MFLRLSAEAEKLSPIDMRQVGMVWEGVRGRESKKRVRDREGGRERVIRFSRFRLGSGAN